MTNISPAIHQDAEHQPESNDQPHQIDVDPVLTALHSFDLNLLRYLVHEHQIPMERFREAAHQLGLADFLDENRDQFRLAGDLPHIQRRAITAVLFTTFVNTLHPGDAGAIPASTRA